MTDGEDERRRSRDSVEGIRLCLSGGGHRATLFDIGGMLALVDRGLNARVAQVSSVSGGSITNAFVATHCDFRSVSPDDFADVVRDLTERVADGGVLRRHHMIGVGAAVMGASVAARGLRRRAPRRFRPLAGALSPFVAAAPLLGTGQLVERRLNATFLGDGDITTLGALADRNVEHVFCATDLVLGEPVYFSTVDARCIRMRVPESPEPSAAPPTKWTRDEISYRLYTIAQRLRDDRVRPDTGMPLTYDQRFDASAVTLGEIVRSSAGFPGVAPRRLPVRKLANGTWVRFDDQGPVEVDIDETAAGGLMFLADGGLWNNLGTQARDDRVFRGVVSLLDDLPHTLVLNASRRHSAVAGWPFHVPLVSLAMAFYRSLGSLNTNAVEPRVGQYRKDRQQAIEHLNRLDALAATRQIAYRTLRFAGRDERERDAIERLMARWRAGKALLDPEEFDDPAVAALAAVVREAYATLDRVPVVVDMESLPLQRYKDLDIRAGSFRTSHFVELQDRVFASLNRQRVLRLGSIDTKTTLARLDPELAIALVIAGYVHTFYWSNYLKTFEEHDVDLVDGVVDRLVERFRPPNVKLLSERIKELLPKA